MRRTQRHSGHHDRRLHEPVCACAARPPKWLKATYKVDLDVEETIEELNIAPLPDELLGEASTRLLEAGLASGQSWAPMDKFIDPLRSNKFRCGATCMTGCRCGAKWTANEFMDQAIAEGAELVTNARVDEVTVEDGVATGVQGVRSGRIPFAVHARVVAVAAGGLGPP